MTSDQIFALIVALVMLWEGSRSMNAFRRGDHITAFYRLGWLFLIMFAWRLS